MAKTRNSPSLSPRKTVLPLMRAEGRAGWKKIAWSFSGAGLATRGSAGALLVLDSFGCIARSRSPAKTGDGFDFAATVVWTGCDAGWPAAGFCVTAVDGAAAGWAVRALTTRSVEVLCASVRLRCVKCHARKNPKTISAATAAG